MRLLGLDVGDKTIGVAVSDPLGYTAQGITTIRRSSRAADLAALQALCLAYEVEGIVVGLPKNMNGSIGPRAEKVQAFAGLLKSELGLEVLFQDERLSTVAAEGLLLEADLSRSKRKKVIDKVAATFILQAYLDALRLRGRI